MTTRKTKKQAPGKRLLVLDTNVLMHNPWALMSFQEHDVYLPSITIQELDDHKGDRERDIGRTSRQSLRLLDELLNLVDPDFDIDEGIPLSLLSAITVAESDQIVAPTGLLFLQSKTVDTTAGSFSKDTPDNQLLAVAYDLKVSQKKNVVVVSKDRAVRIKARALKIPSEDYKNDQTIDDIKLLYSGYEELPLDFWKTVKAEASWDHDKSTYWNITTPLAKSWKPNQFLYLVADEKADKIFNS